MKGQTKRKKNSLPQSGNSPIDVSNEDLFISSYSFKHFYNTIFAQSVYAKWKKFVMGDHIDEICDRIQDNLMTATKSARKHSKSHILYAYVMWKTWLVWNGWYWKDDYEIFYGCFKEDYAGRHIGRIRRYIELNPHFAGLPMATDADTIIKVEGKRENGDKFVISVLPMGMLAFKRGEHPDLMILDDILRDERKKNKTEFANLNKITDTFKEELMSMPQEETGELHLAGTPQDKTDVFSHVEKMEGFNYKEYKAITDLNKRIVLWPEMYSWSRLMDIKYQQLGPKAFNKEYMCSPERSEDAYIKDEEIGIVVVNDLTNYLEYLDKDDKMIKSYIDSVDGQIFGGMDIGKKRHPSHICLYLRETYVLKDANGPDMEAWKYTQIGEKWLDHWQYTKQKDLANRICKVFQAEAFGVDNTRGEFEGYEEDGELNGEIKLIIFNHKNQNKYAAELDKLINFQGSRLSEWEFQPIEILDASRQNSQITSVDNNLDAIETPSGHGDSFWSHILMLMVAKAGGSMMRKVA